MNCPGLDQGHVRTFVGSIGLFWFVRVKDEEEKKVAENGKGSRDLDGHVTMHGSGDSAAQWIGSCRSGVHPINSRFRVEEARRAFTRTRTRHCAGNATDCAVHVLRFKTQQCAVKVPTATWLQANQKNHP